jgi:hypothetical protein
MKKTTLEVTPEKLSQRHESTTAGLSHQRNHTLGGG